jgi:hypothetical protein
MKKAYDDTELLKAIVLPLEEQIHALKDKLRQTDYHLNEAEKRQTKIVLGVEALVQWLDGKSYEEAAMHLDKRQKKLLSFSELKQREQVEDECDTNYSTGDATSIGDYYLASNESKDTRMFISLLYTRIALLQKELLATNNELSNHMNLNDKARKNNTDLRNQVYNANSEVIRLQKNHLSEVTRISSVLNEEQKCEVSLRKDKENENTQMNEETPTMSYVFEKVDVDALMTVKKFDWLNLQTELNKVRALLGVGVEEHLVGGEKFKELQSRFVLVHHFIRIRVYSA